MRRPYGPEEGTVNRQCSVRKCKRLCSDVYTSASCARAQHYLPGCFLCIILKFKLNWVWRLAECCFLLFFLFCFLLSCDEKDGFLCASRYCKALTWTLFCRLMVWSFWSPPPPPSLSGYSVGENARLQHVAQMDALKSHSSEGSCYGDLLPGGCFFSWVAVGSQRQLHEQWERGRWIWVSHG